MYNFRHNDLGLAQTYNNCIQKLYSKIVFKNCIFIFTYIFINKNIIFYDNKLKFD